MRSNTRNYILTAASAVAILFFCPTAQANTYLFTSGTASSSEIVPGPAEVPITVYGYNYNGVTNGTQGSYSLGSPSLSTLSYNSTYGLGVADTPVPNDSNGGIYLNGANSSAVVIDFSNAESHGATTATFYIDNADSGWRIFGGNSPGNGLVNLTSLVTGSLNATQPVSLSGYRYLTIVGYGTCYLNISEIGVNNTTTPEPGTTMMAGMALIGLAMALRKARKRS